MSSQNSSAPEIICGIAPYARLAVAGLIQDRAANEAGEGRWFLLHRTEPWDGWDPPGGRVEHGETLEQAVIREVAEETNLEVEVGGPCYVRLFDEYKGERMIVVTMACRVRGDTSDVRVDPEAGVGWRWASTAEWENMAEKGVSGWQPVDVRRVTRMAPILWEAGNSG